MKNNYSILIIILLLILLTGCLQYNPDIDIYLEEDNKIEKIEVEIKLTDNGQESLKGFSETANYQNQEDYVRSITKATLIKNNINYSDIVVEKNKNKIEIELKIEDSKNIIEEKEEGYLIRLDQEIEVPNENIVFNDKFNIFVHVENKNIVNTNLDKKENNLYKMKNITNEKLIYYETSPDLTKLYRILIILLVSSVIALIYIKRSYFYKEQN